MQPPCVLFTNSLDHTLVCLLGMLLSLYAINVETKKKKNPKYVAACDFNHSMSCSRVLTSEYGSGFGLTSKLLGKDSVLNIPNCVLGLVFYGLQLVIGLWSPAWGGAVLYYMCAVSCVSSLYLAYILAFVLKDLCVVCIGTYIVNFTLLYLTRQRYLVDTL